MEPKPKSLEMITQALPHRIGESDMQEAKDSLTDLNNAVQKDTGKPVNWQQLYILITSFNQTVGDFL